jgi:hypothetical protein
MLNSFQTLDVRSLVIFSGIKIPSSPMSCSENTQTNPFGKKIPCWFAYPFKKKDPKENQRYLCIQNHSL